jgi:hypothetical protein
MCSHPSGERNRRIPGSVVPPLLFRAVMVRSR